MSIQDLTISATQFKAKCLALLDDLAEGRLHRIVITKRGKVVGQISPPQAKGDIFGCMRDMVMVVPGADPTEPLVAEPDDPFLGKPGDPLLAKVP